MSKFNIHSPTSGNVGANIPVSGLVDGTSVFQWPFSKFGWYEMLKLDVVVRKFAYIATIIGENSLYAILAILAVLVCLIILVKSFKCIKKKRVEYIRKQKYG